MGEKYRFEITRRAFWIARSGLKKNSTLHIFTYSVLCKNKKTFPKPNGRRQRLRNCVAQICASVLIYAIDAERALALYRVQLCGVVQIELHKHKKIHS